MQLLWHFKWKKKNDMKNQDNEFVVCNVVCMYVCNTFVLIIIINKIKIRA